jgi:hypothetical protein
LNARPSWGRFEDEVAGNTEQFAPQPSQPLDVFVRSTPLAGKVEHAYVICRFQSFNAHDSHERAVDRRSLSGLALRAATRSVSAKPRPPPAADAASRS